jgi:hypothetical protein
MQLERRRDEIIDFPPRHYVASKTGDVEACASHLGGRTLTLVGFIAGEDDARPGTRKLLCYRAPDSARPAGDQRHFARQVEQRA